MPKSLKKTVAARPSGAAAKLQLELQYLPISSVRPDATNARSHSQRQLVRLEAVVAEFGFTNPILIDETSVIIAGHARLEVAQMLGMKTVPCVRLSHLSASQKTALALADNKLGDMSEFDPERLAAQLAQLCSVDFNVELTGFETAEMDIILETPLATTPSMADPADDFASPDRDASAVSQLGDHWLLGNHHLHCADSLVAESYEEVLGEARAAMVITDPPFNQKIQGHVSGLGKAKHREFAMASGEMSQAEFIVFLKNSMRHLVEYSRDGSIHYIFMDAAHILEIAVAGAETYTEFKALCVWNKSSGGMGSLYRSKHELIFVYKNGTASHQNNILLGKFGRYRTNVWDYAGVNTFGRNRDTDLAAHPTVKPVGLIADAIRDCSKRGDIILDPFAGSGTILVAAERTGRRAAAIELDPHYVDNAVKRWQEATGAQATLSSSGQTFAEVAAERESAAGDESLVAGGEK